MDKKIFPGGTTAKMREEARRKKEEEKLKERLRKQESRKFHKAINAEFRQREREELRKFLERIGPATILLMARRGLTAFLATVALEIGLGSGFWAVGNVESSAGAKPKEYRREWLASIKSAYNVTNLFDGDKWTRKACDKTSDALETLIAILLLCVAVKMGHRQVKDDVKIAKQTLKVNVKSAGEDLYKIKTAKVYSHSKGLLWKLHPVSRAVIKNLSSQDPMLFDALLNGETSKPSRDYAMTVIRGYLETHPDDLQKVLDVYEMETLPKSLLRKYGQHTR